MKSLWFKEMDQRRKLVATAAHHTGTWLSCHLLQSQNFRTDPMDPEETKRNEAECEDELDREHIMGHRTVCRACYDLDPVRYSTWSESGGLLWVAGKAGSGKSTLMKQTILEAERYSRSRGVTVINFFFNARGTAIERSPTSLFRTLIHQLLNTLKAKPVFDNPVLMEYRKRRDTQTTVIWHLEDLKLLFREMCFELGSTRIMVFLDAFDEMQDEPGNSASEIMRYFDSIVLELAGVHNPLKLCICFSSRPVSLIDVWWPEQYVKFNMQDENRCDIKLYVDSVLQSLQRFTNEINFAPISKVIIARADGVFLWVTLVLKEILNEIQNATQEELEQRLHDIPTELSDLYRLLLKRIHTRRRTEALRMFQVALYANESLHVDEFRVALSVGRTPPFKSFEDMDQATSVVKTSNRMQERLYAYTEGLLETRQTGFFQESRTIKVQVLHQSVKDFLLSDEGLEILQVGSRDDFETDAHSYLLRACISAITMAAGTYESTEMMLANSESQLYLRHLDFFQYASRTWTFHAKRSSVEAQRMLMDHFLAQSGLVFDFLKREAYGFDDTDQKTLFDVVVSRDLVECVKYLLEIRIVDPGASEQSVERVVDLWTAKSFCRDDHEMADLLLNWRMQAENSDDCLVNLLQYASSSGKYDAFQKVIDMGAILDMRGGIFGTCLNAAILGSEHSSDPGPLVIDYILGKAPTLVCPDPVNFDPDAEGPSSIPVEIVAATDNTYSFSRVLQTTINLDAAHLINPEKLLMLSMVQKKMGMMGMVLRALGEHLSAGRLREIAEEAIAEDHDDVRNHGDILMGYLAYGHSTESVTLDPPGGALHEAIRAKKTDLIEFLLFRYAYSRAREELQSAHKVARKVDLWTRYGLDVESKLIPQLRC